MPEHMTATREEWEAARDDLAKLEAEHAELTRKVTEQRRQLPWVAVEKARGGRGRRGDLAPGTDKLSQSVATTESIDLHGQ